MSEERAPTVSGAVVTGPAPVSLPPNPVFRFYRGGEGIDRLRGVESGPGAPEDWVGSTTTSFGHATEGLAHLSDGTVVRELIAADPVGYLGPEHVERLGANPGLLVKLLDAGERLAVHFHPDREFARGHLQSQFGKTEAWLILAAEPGAHMHLGLRRAIGVDTLARWVAEQDSSVMLDALQKVPVSSGDVLFVPTGTLHTIGAGITLIELQEPSDMSVVIEWRHAGVSVEEANLKLGWDRVLPAADTLPLTPIHLAPEPAADDRSTATRLLPPAADPYFRAERVVINGLPLTLEPSFSILIGTEGELMISAGSHQPIRLARGAAALIPHGAGGVTFSGRGAAIRCLPPALERGAGQP